MSILRPKSILLSLLLFLMIAVAYFMVSVPSRSWASPSYISNLSAHQQGDPKRLSELLEITTGDLHSCALTTSGDVYCWGDNEHGQLGDGTNTSSLLPVRISTPGRSVFAVSAGRGHTCAVLENGAAACWGKNDSGQLGTGTTDESNAPVAVSGLFPNAVAVTAGWEHSCALSLSGGVACWGSNGDGQLGNGTTEDSTNPVVVTGLTSGVLAIAAGLDHTCALTDEFTVYCWGDNWRGDLGDGTMEDSSIPVMTTGLNLDVTAITAGYNHTCAINALGGVQCWGANTDGELGNGQTAERVLTPIDVSGLSSSVLRIDAGGDHTCAQVASGDVYCWGSNVSGQLGNGNTEGQLTPVLVDGLGGDASFISAGNVHTCAVLNPTETAQCWGSDVAGQLGANGIQQSSIPVDVLAEGGNIVTPTTSPTPVPATNTPIPTSTPEATQTSRPTNTRIPPTLTFTPTPASTLTPTSTPIVGGTGGDTKLYLAYHSNSLAPTAAPTSAPSAGWQKISNQALLVDSLAISGNRLFATDRREAGNGGGIYSHDISGCANGAFVNSGAVDGIVLGIDFDGSRGLAAAFDNGLRYSQNGGASWATATGIQGESYSVAFAGQSSYAGAGTGVYHSGDNGATWQTITNVGQPINVIRRISSSLWLGTDGDGVQELTLGNNALIPQSNGLVTSGSQQVWDILIADIDTIYLATFDGVFRGSGFDTWQRVGTNQGGSDLVGTETRSFSIDGDQLFVGTMGQGVYQISLSNPTGWSQVTTGEATSANWTVRDLLFDDVHCQGLLAGTDDGVWLLR